MGMTESQKLSRRGLQVLAEQRWPEDQATALMHTFMQAGFQLCLEKQEEQRQRNEALIERAVIQ